MCDPSEKLDSQTFPTVYFHLCFLAPVETVRVYHDDGIVLCAAHYRSVVLSHWSESRTALSGLLKLLLFCVTDFVLL